ncbi:MAG: carboxylating nicotinate-nucleotide diphosphorylase [Candidatus Abyssobacteria bacterium SURF_5]|uniref:Probable nicotinate-nucleotide pyrophosphorylase [carboxylating] n=1 Tax=Abyssobacteria bacterium (strain SURF_5) TaxID=2093360 RepID=A0A3A4NQI4_ABYX5|nr:MAG: carboxylating nicotinate-nucleotide diphosphorylase [Candidatus Abyssubacteria bacterium SURF_5]
MNLLQVSQIIDQALSEDIGAGDLTTDSVIAPDALATGEIICRAAGVAAGIPIAGLCFRRLDSRITFEQLVDDGARVTRNRVLARISGSAQPILKAERVALNFIQRLSGIATLTARYVAAVSDYPVKILDTRKTTPGLRVLEKYAVRAGGGFNHRFALFDGILIKDNHLIFQHEDGSQSGSNQIERAVARAKRLAGHLRKIEVEAETLDQVKQALRAGADAILLDNMDVATLAKAVEITRNSRRPVILEASGNVSLSNIKKIAAAGVDVISIGALTHSAPALDVSLELQSVVG